MYIAWGSPADMGPAEERCKIHVGDRRGKQAFRSADWLARLPLEPEAVMVVSFLDYVPDE